MLPPDVVERVRLEASDQETASAMVSAPAAASVIAPLTPNAPPLSMDQKAR